MKLYNCLKYGNGRYPSSSGYAEEIHVLKDLSSNPSTGPEIDIFTAICCKKCTDVCLNRPKKTPGYCPY